MTPTLPDGFHSASVPVKDIQMHYVSAGSGPVVMIVHGGWDSWWAWREIAPTLAASHTVIMPALRGLAETTKPSDGYDANNLGDDLYQLLRQLGHKRCTLVGHDWGAVACYTLAAQHPEVVERFAIFEMTLPGLGLLEQAIIPRPGGAYLWHFALHCVPDIPEMLIEGHLRDYMKWFFTHGAATLDAVGDESLDHYVELYSQPGAMPAFLQYYRELWVHAEQIKEHMAHAKLGMPVMAYGGDASIGPGVQMSMGQLADRVDGGVIPNCGHWVAEEQPDFVLARLQEFLATPESLASQRSVEAY
jgi:pimeloyl-ACP methyl ester carboxylesterase